MELSRIEKRYRIRGIQASFLRIDILIVCRYILIPIPKDEPESEPKKKPKKKIKVYDVWRCLMYYDYRYYTKFRDIKEELKILFPLHHNRRKRNHHFKISKLLINYWGNKFGITYQQHESVYTVFDKQI